MLKLLWQPIRVIGFPNYEKGENVDMSLDNLLTLTDFYYVSTDSNTYLLMKRDNEAAKALHTAFAIRMEYYTLRTNRIP